MKAEERAESGEAPWIKKRGIRHGNNRKMYARGKVLQRRRDKAKLKREIDYE